MSTSRDNFFVSEDTENEEPTGPISIPEDDDEVELDDDLLLDDDEIDPDDDDDSDDETEDDF